MKASVNKVAALLGAKGGAATGASKIRGDKDYYKKISALAVAARKEKKKENNELRNHTDRNHGK